MRLFRRTILIINVWVAIGMLLSSCSDRRAAARNNWAIVPDSSNIFQQPGDSMIRVLALGENVTPSLGNFVLPLISEDTTALRSFIKYLPFLFFITLQYDNKVYRSPGFYCENLNDCIVDVYIYNLKELEKVVGRDKVSLMMNRMENAYKRNNPTYQYQKYYPDTLLYRPQLLVNKHITEGEYFRLKALNGDKDALIELEEQLRSADQIAELAYYYYFIAFTQDKPDYLYDAAAYMYEASKRHPYCLSGAINILNTGEKMGSKKCREALSAIQGVTDSIASKFKTDTVDSRESWKMGATINYGTY